MEIEHISLQQNQITKNLSTITGNLGLIYSSASNDQLALTYLFEAEQTAKTLDWKDHLATIYGNIANVFLNIQIMYVP